MKILKTLAFGSILLTSIATNAQQPENIRFGIIADIQYCDCETRGNRFYRNSLAKLASCINDLNTENVEFTVNLGDLVDRETKENLDSVLPLLNKLNNKIYNIAGNHDYGDISDNKDLYAQLGMPAPYYSFVRKGWRFIMLNTNEVASYSNIKGTPLEDELKRMMDKIRKTGRKNGESYNGGISKKQLKWLRNELKSAEKEKEKVIVFSHHPLYAAPGFTALNDLEIIKVLSSFSCVKAVISGHHHSGDFGTYKKIPFITTEGMIETEKESAYGIVTIYSDRIIITGKGRTKSYFLTISST
ncbi:MAG: metallophosphoesterase [Tannerella sp.]|jgi:manganese-dependent ADP-ribose/CDP-alcohol diphosphatase|nr:metallophosphoesterase [Tannerella sp.]